MADKEISGLPRVPQITEDSLLPVYVPGSTSPAQAATGKQFADFARESADAHVQRAEKAATAAEQAKTDAQSAAAKAKTDATAVIEKGKTDIAAIVEQGKVDVGQLKLDAETAAERSEAARDSIILDEQKMAQAVRDATEQANLAGAEADRATTEANRSGVSADEAEEWANKAQGYAESAAVPAVAGVYNFVLADRVTGERYALIIENGRPKLLGVADTLDAATMRLIDTSTGVAYELIVESGRLKTLEVE